MDKVILNALQFNRILDLIQPVGEAGRHHKFHLSSWKCGQEAGLTKEYMRLEALLSVTKTRKKTAEQLSSALSHTPYLPQTLKAISERSLLFHELFELKKFIYYARQLHQTCLKNGLAKHYPFPELTRLFTILDPERTDTPTFALTAAFDVKLATCLNSILELQKTGQKEIQQRLKEAAKSLGMANLPAEIVVSRTQKQMIKKLSASEYYLLTDENFANLTFRLSDSGKLTDIKKQISAKNQKLAKIEADVIAKLSRHIRAFEQDLLTTAELVKILDWDYAKTVFAIQYKCIIPQVCKDIGITLKQAVNLPLLNSLKVHNRRYQPLDLHFSATLNVITGPNMGGKTTLLKTVGQFCALTQYALPVPASEARICLFDQIWFNQEVEGGENLSSFGKEMVSLAAILKKKGRHLLLFDELAKGTNPTEGEALLTATLGYLAAAPSLVLAATHYERPAKLDKVTQFAIKGIDTKALKKLSAADKHSLDAQLDLLNQLMDYGLIKLSAKTNPPQNAIPIADILGLPKEIITTADKLLN